MILVILVDLIALISILYVASKKGLEGALPTAAFFLITLPEESKLPLGLFDITTQRFVTLILLILSLTAGKRAAALPQRLPLKGWVIAIALWWTLSTANSVVLTDSIKALLSLFLDYLVIYVIFAKNITSFETLRRILFGVAAGLIVCSFFGTIEAYANWSVVSLFPTEVHRFGASGGLYVDDARGIRVQSTFGHPILFGSALAMGIPITLYLIENVASRSQKIFLWTGLLLEFVSIFKTSSRGPWMALIFSLLPFLVLGKTKMRRYIMVICLLAVTVLLVRPGVLETVWNDYTATVDNHSSQGESYQYRYVLYRIVMDKVGESPMRMLWGYGPQSFPSLHLSGAINGRWMNFVSCDSSFAALLVETGYVGLGMMALFLGYVLLATIRFYRRAGRPENLICIVFFVNLASFIFEMTNVAILGWGQQTILLWAIIAMAMAFPHVHADAPPERIAPLPEVEPDSQRELAMMHVSLREAGGEVTA